MAFTGIESFTAIGIQSFFWALAPGGLPLGPNGVIANGASAGMSKLDLIKSFDVTEPDTETVYPTGNNGASGGFQLEPNTLPTAALVTGARNQTFAAKSNGIKIAASGSRNLLGLIPLCNTYGQQVFLMNSPAKSIEIATMGQRGFVVNAVMNVTNNSKGFTTMTERAVREWSNNLNLDRSSVTPWGEPFDVDVHGSSAFVGVEFTHPYQVHIKTVRGNGVIDELALDEQLAVASADNIWVWDEDGNELDYTTDFTGDVATNKVSFEAVLVSTKAYFVAYGFLGNC